MIALVARHLVIGPAAILAANGGQGGGGCDSDAAGTGVDGLAAAVAGFVSNNEGEGGDGGRGGVDVSLLGQTGSTGGRGGGGGGGGVGRIQYRAHDSSDVAASATVSPDAAVD
jgi:hypothetical protein